MEMSCKSIFLLQNYYFIMIRYGDKSMKQYICDTIFDPRILWIKYGIAIQITTY